jgi:hypothetical protein
VTAGQLDAALVRLRGFHYQAEVSPPDAFLALLVLAGTGTVAFGRDEVSLTRGDVMLDATDLQHTAPARWRRRLFGAPRPSWMLMRGARSPWLR